MASVMIFSVIRRLFSGEWRVVCAASATAPSLIIAPVLKSALTNGDPTVVSSRRRATAPRP